MNRFAEETKQIFAQVLLVLLVIYLDSKTKDQTKISMHLVK